MEFGSIFLLIQLICWTIGGVGAALLVGIKALRLSRGAIGDRRFALSMIGVNMCEPAINVLIIPLLISLVGVGADKPRGIEGSWLVMLVIVTVAMAMLLLPAVGMRSDDPLCAQTCDMLVAMGLARWMWTLLTLCSMMLGLLVMFPGFVLLWVCVARCRRQSALLAVAPGRGAADREEARVVVGDAG